VSALRRLQASFFSFFSHVSPSKYFSAVLFFFSPSFTSHAGTRKDSLTGLVAFDELNLALSNCICYHLYPECLCASQQ